MIEYEFIEDLTDILNDCEECGHCTLSYHATMCSNEDHRILAKLLSNVPALVDDSEREDYEDQIAELETELFTRECDINRLTNTIYELNEKLKIWTELCSVENQNQNKQ